MSDTSNKITFTPSQQDAFDKIIAFVEDPKSRVFILNGYAGTGKTTITKQVIKRLDKLKKSYNLCASTGRAAKILSDLSGSMASTVHSLIYKYSDFNRDLETEIKLAQNKQTGGELYLVFSFEPRPENEQGSIYIIDEASMVSDIATSSISQAKFGSGRLLSDLMKFDPQGKFIFIGDNCQLPPVGQPISPALTPQSFKEVFGITPQSASLTEIMRQSDGNDIIEQSAIIRQEYHRAPSQPYTLPNNRNDWHYLYWRNCENIKVLPNQQWLINQYVSKIRNYDYNKTTLITRTNPQCQKLALAVRKKLGFSGTVNVNDLLLVTQNNLVSGLMNGDLVRVKEIGGTTSMAGLQFINVTVENIANGNEFQQYMIADVINGFATNLTPEQQHSLFVNFAIRMRDQKLTQHDERFKENMKTDPYLNALRCVYGYALTCHKAQGGEWEEVYLDMPRNITLNPVKSNYQWIYTSMTRAKKYLYVANDFFIR